MTEKKSTVQIALDSWQLFCSHHRWMKEACCITLYYPVFASYHYFHALTARCGTSRSVQAQPKALETFDLQLEKRQRQHKRRNSLTGNFSTTWKPDGFLKRRDRWYDQKSSPLFSKLPPELRIKIYALVLNEQNLLRIVPNEREGKFRISHVSVYKHAEFSSETSHMMYDIFQDWGGYAGQARPSGISLLSLLLSCRRIYAEAISVLYSGNTFVVTEGYDVHNFVRYLPEAHAKSIKSLIIFIPNGAGFIWDAGTYHVLLGLENLRSCRIVIVKDYLFGLEPHAFPPERDQYQNMVEHFVQTFPKKDSSTIDAWIARARYRRGEDLSRREHAHAWEWVLCDDSLGRVPGASLWRGAV